jgi:hypothetical protein
LNSAGEANFRILAAQYPGLAEKLLREAPEDLSEGDIRIETAQSGDPTLLARGLHVHSPRDPVREGRRLAESAGGEGPIVILGFGLGYAAEAAAAAAPDRPLVVVERHPAILKAALETRDLSVFLTKRRALFVTGGSPDAVTGALRLLEGSRAGAWGDGKYVLIRNRALTSLDPEWYAEAERRINAWSSREDVNTATLRRFGKRWVRNLAANREILRDTPGVSELFARLPPLPFPALLVAAGPSLDRVAPLLPELAKRAVVVAVDTSQRLLLERGVDPDFTVAVDPQYWNARHLDRAPAPHTCLVAESAVWPSVLREPFAHFLLCASLFPLGRFIEERIGAKGSLGAGGSVATTAWDFARALVAGGPPASGSSPETGVSQKAGGNIWVAGLDLSFPDLKTHFRGALFEKRALAETRRFTPAETLSVRALRDGFPFRAPSANGGEVFTDKRLSLYASWFENQARLYPGIRSHSLSPEGLALDGFPPSSVEELLALPPRRAEIRALLGEAFSGLDRDFNAPAVREERSRRYRAASKDLLRGLENLRILAAESARLAAGSSARDSVLRRLDEANRLIMESEVKDIAGFLFPPLAELEASLQSPETDPHGRHLELSAKLYRSLAETTEYHLRILSHNIESIGQ